MKMQELYEKSSKKDYVAVAAIIKSSADKKTIAERLAAHYAKDNALFDRDRFLTACGLKAGE